jgi:hypothetical protein
LMPDSSAATEMPYTPRSEVGGLPGLWSSLVIAAIDLSCFGACQPKHGKKYGKSRKTYDRPLAQELAAVLYKNLLILIEIIIASSEDYPVTGTQIVPAVWKG